MDKDILLKIELPKGWAKATISEMISADGVFVDGDWIESKDQDQNGDVRLIQLADIGDGEFRDKSSRFLTLKKANEIGCTFLLEGDILVARMPDPIGRACLFPLKGENKYVTAVDVAIIRTGKESINNKLLNYFINSPIIRNKIEALQSGTTRKRISRGNLSLIEFPVPPVNEQNRIVNKLDELLSELEKGKEQLQTSLEQLTVYRQSILKHAFEGKLSKKWRRKQNKLKSIDQIVLEINQYHEAEYEADLKKYKAGKMKIKPKTPQVIGHLNITEISFPNTWAIAKLKHISKRITDGSHNPPSKKNEGYPMISAQNVKDWKILFDNFRYISKSEYEIEASRAKPEPGDILLSIVGTIGRTAVVPEYSIEFALQRSLALIKKGPIDSRFVSYYLSSYIPQRYFEENAKGTAQKGIYLGILNELIIPVPEQREQEKIVDILDQLFSNCDKMEETIIENLNTSEIIKQSLLQKAFEGKLVEQETTDEPASELLGRIKKERDDNKRVQKERKKTEKPFHTKTRKMPEELKRITELLKESKEPVSAKTLWQSSIHKDDIDEFYATLKKHIEAGEVIELPRKGKESFLKLANSK